MSQQDWEPRQGRPDLFRRPFKNFTLGLGGVEVGSSELTNALLCCWWMGGAVWGMVSTSVWVGLEGG